MPDSFNTTERIGHAISGAVGGKPKPGEFATYFTPDKRTAATASSQRAYQLLRQHARKPIKKSR